MRHVSERELAVLGTEETGIECRPRGAIEVEGRVGAEMRRVQGQTRWGLVLGVMGLQESGRCCEGG